jgi:ABC-type Fe3+/spermidine/putrescine transport system ATPase subunit
MRDGVIRQTAPPKELYERPATRFVADFVGVNNFIPGVCRELADDQVVADTALGRVRGRATAMLKPGDRCVVAVRPENIALGPGSENTFEGQVVLASYLGNTLRYDVETNRGPLLKVDIRDPWHHQALPAGERVTVSFPPSAALMLADE